MACRLAAAGRSVLVLERGRRWTPDQYPRTFGDAWIWDINKPHKRNGWIDLRFMDDMVVAQGAGVGGGSLIYANVSIDAKPETFNSGWPSPINAKVLKPYYKKVAAMLGSASIPDNQLTERFKLMKAAATEIGEKNRFRKVDLAITFDKNWTYNKKNAIDPIHSKSWINQFGKKQGTCIHCGYCDLGCKVQAKNTLDLNYLADAEKSGAKIEPLALVNHLAWNRDHWLVRYEKISEEKRESAQISAHNVILAAGSLGSTEILLRSRDEFRTLPNLSKALGHNWSSNGDFLTPALYKDREISPTIGPTITCAIDFLDGAAMDGRYFVEDGGFANLLKSFSDQQPKMRGRSYISHRLLRRVGKALKTNHIMPWFGQAIDASDGRMYLGRNWLAPWQFKLKMDWNAKRSEKAVNGLIAMHKKLTCATGGEFYLSWSWSIFRTLITPHPLGGCSMATSPATGVVDHCGCVFNHPGLYVIDGSIIPRAIGLNPSKTIAAIAERAAEEFLKK